MRLLTILLGKTPEEKMSILYRIHRKLIDQHNSAGEQFRNGVITQEQWDTYQRSFDTRLQKVMKVHNVIRENQGLMADDQKDQRQQIKEIGWSSSQYDPDIDIDNIQD